MKKGSGTKEHLNLTIFDEGTILFSIFATIGKMSILKTKSTLNQAICALIPNTDIVLPDYLYYVLMAERDNLEKGSRYRTQSNSNQTKLKTSEIPVIEDTKIQKKFLEEINPNKLKYEILFTKEDDIPFNDMQRVKEWVYSKK